MDWLEVLKEFVTPVSVGLFMLYINKRDNKNADAENAKDQMFFQIINSVDACMSLSLTLAEIIRENHDCSGNEELMDFGLHETGRQGKTSPLGRLLGNAGRYHHHSYKGW